MPLNAEIQTKTLLWEGDPRPLELINEFSKCPIVLVCEHAGQSIPMDLGDLGISKADMQRHIAYDIGAKQVAMQMAEFLNAPLVMQPYSRLVIDCNRPVDAEDAIPDRSGGIEIPGNCNLDFQDRKQRIEEIYLPFHDSISEILDRHRRIGVFSIHSFTPLLNSEQRPWDLAFLFRKDAATSQALADAVRRFDPTPTIGMNEPYVITDSTDWFVPYHGERRGLAHSLIEIRNDHLYSDESCRSWALLLSQAIGQFLEKEDR